MEGQEDGLRQKKARELENGKRELEGQEMLKKALGQLLEPKAYERLMIVKSQNPQMHAACAQWIITLAQKGALNGRIDEQTLRNLLLKISGQKRETKIEFVRKGNSEGL